MNIPWTAIALIVLFVFLAGLAAAWWTASGGVIAAAYIIAAVVIFLAEVLAPRIER